MATHEHLTVRLPRSVITKARVLAAERGTSISTLVAETIEALVTAGGPYEAAKRLALQDLGEGLSLGGPPYLTRDETHAR